MGEFYGRKAKIIMCCHECKGYDIGGEDKLCMHPKLDEPRVIHTVGDETPHWCPCEQPPE